MSYIHIIQLKIQVGLKNRGFHIDCSPMFARLFPAQPEGALARSARAHFQQPHLFERLMGDAPDLAASSSGLPIALGSGRASDRLSFDLVNGEFNRRPIATINHPTLSR